MPKKKSTPFGRQYNSSLSSALIFSGGSENYKRIVRKYEEHLASKKEPVSKESSTEQSLEKRIKEALDKGEAFEYNDLIYTPSKKNPDSCY